MSQQVTELCGGKFSPPRCLYFGLADLCDLLESTGGGFREVGIYHVELNAYGKSADSPHQARNRGCCKHTSGQKKEKTSGKLHFSSPSQKLVIVLCSGRKIRAERLRNQFLLERNWRGRRDSNPRPLP